MSEPLDPLEVLRVHRSVPGGCEHRWRNRQRHIVADCQVAQLARQLLTAQAMLEQAHDRVEGLWYKLGPDTDREDIAQTIYFLNEELDAYFAALSATETPG